MKKQLVTRIAAGILAGGLMGMIPGVAYGAGTTSGTSSTSGASNPTSGQPSNPTCTPAAFSKAQQFVESQLQDRVSQLSMLQNRVSAAKDLTASDAATLQSDLANQQSGINGLVQKVPGDTTCAQLAADAKSMVYEYRVYLVMTPQVDLVIVVDTESEIAATLTNAEPVIEQAIAAAQKAGKDVSGAEQAFSDYQAQVTAAQSSVNGVSANVLAQTPQGYDTNPQGVQSVFLGARTSATNARNDLHQAAADLMTIVKDLK